MDIQGQDYTLTFIYMFVFLPIFIYMLVCSASSDFFHDRNKERGTKK